MSIPTLDKLREDARSALATARRQLTETRSLTPLVRLIDAADGSGDQFIVIEGRIMNSAAQKEAFSSLVRAQVDEHGFFAAIFVSDIWIPSPLTSEQGQKIDLVRKVMDCDLVTACKMLGIPVHEAILVWLQSVDRSVTFQQIYERDADGNVLNFGEPTEGEGPVESSAGRMWFLSDRRKAIIR